MRNCNHLTEVLDRAAASSYSEQTLHTGRTPGRSAGGAPRATLPREPWLGRRAAGLGVASKMAPRLTRKSPGCRSRGSFHFTGGNLRFPPVGPPSDTLQLVAGE